MSTVRPTMPDKIRTAVKERGSAYGPTLSDADMLPLSSARLACGRVFLNETMG